MRAADVRVPTLDDVFLSLTGRSLREEIRGGGGLMSVVTGIATSTSAPAGSRGSLVSDTLAVFQREMYLVLRDPFSVIFSLVQPLVFLGLFGALLAGSVDSAVLGGSPLQWFLPGVIVMICLFGTGVAGSNLLFEITLGSYERVLASPLRRSSILIGKSLKELAPLVVQAALVTAGLHPVRVRALPAARAGRAADPRASSGSAWARSPTRWPWRSASGSGCSGRCSSRCCSRC